MKLKVIGIIAILLASIFTLGCMGNTINPTEEKQIITQNRIYEWNASLFAIVNEYTKNIKDYESGKIDDSDFIELSSKRGDEASKLGNEIYEILKPSIEKNERPTNLQLTAGSLMVTAIYTSEYARYNAMYFINDDTSSYKLGEGSKKQEFIGTQLW
ncbi:hypothetical protein ig2599ANME_0833 [groundwater metagenome]